MSIQNESDRIHLRGDLATFQAGFFEDVNNTIPITPVDISQYPAFTIYDPDNNAIQSGVGQAVSTPGFYKTSFQVPVDATLSFDNQRWRVEWVLVSDNNQQFNFTEEFDVEDTVITASETREQKFITLSRQDYRAQLRQTIEPAELELDVFLFGDPNNKIYNAALGTGGGILTAKDGDSIVFYTDIPAAVMADNCAFSLIWKVRDSVTEPFNFVYQSLSAITPRVLEDVTSVRMIIDKFQKRLGVYNAYEDSDIVEYLVRGHELVNQYYPTTYYGFGNLPRVFTVFHILLSSWYALQAQGLNEVDVAFNFSGQTITLDYDHQGPLADIAGRWQDFIDKNITPAKMSVFRRSTPVGTVANRMMSFTDYYATFTFKVASIRGTTSNVISQLSTLGLLF